MSAAMLAQARKRQAWPASFTFAEGTIDDHLKRETGGFDRIASVNVLWTLADPQRTLAEMVKHLRPAGRMVHVTPRRRFRADVILWRHLRRQKGWALWRALWHLPLLALAGLLNLALVIQGAWSGKPPALRWQAEGLAQMLGIAGLPPRVVRPCYAGQGHLLISEKP
jgi:SAM-dependent methyltransferase